MPPQPPTTSEAPRAYLPAVRRIVAEDARRRAEGGALRAGEYTLNEAADLMGMSAPSVSRLCDLGELENLGYSIRGESRTTRRLSSRSMIAWIIRNTTGPDDAEIAGSIEVVMARLGNTALIRLLSRAQRLLERRGETPPVMPTHQPDLFS